MFLRRFLKILTLSCLLTGTVSSVAACNFNRFKKPTLADKLKKLVIAEIAGNPVYGKYTFGDLFNNTSTITTLAQELIDRVIASYFYQQTKQLWGVWAHSGTSFSFPKVFQAWVISLATDQFYRDYLSAFSSNSPMEDKVIDSNYKIIFSYASDNSKNDSPKLTLPWELADVQYYSYNEKKDEYTALPVLQTNTKSHTEIQAFLDLKGQATTIEEVKARMLNEFYPYIIHIEVPKILKNIIAQAFINKTMFAQRYVSDGGSHVYINRFSSLFSDMMTWARDTGTQVHSNFKMVWEYKVRYSPSVIEGINQEIKTDANAVFSGQGWSPSSYNTAVSEMFTSKNYNYDGQDPIFGVNHFVGFAAYDVTGAIVNGTSFDPVSDQLKAAYKPGFLVASQVTPGQPQYDFLDQTTNPQFATFAFVLPINIPDILNGATINFGSSHSVNIELKNYASAGSFEDLSWQGLGGKDERSVNYLYKYNTKSGINATWGAFASDGKTPMFNQEGNFSDKINTQTFRLLQWAQYLYAQGSSVQEVAKDLLYSIAFDYNQKNIYSENLYNAIGKYIQKKS